MTEIDRTDADQQSSRTRFGIRIADFGDGQPPRSRRERVRNVLFLALFVGAGAAFSAGGIELWRHVTEGAELERTNRARAQLEMTEAGALIGEAVSAVVPVTAELATRLAAGPLPSAAALEGILAELVGANPRLHGVGVAFAPYAFESDRRLYAPYVLRGAGGTIESFDVSEEYDYSRYEHEWFWNPRFDGPRWNEPYYEASTGEIVIEYGVPVHLPGSDPESELANAVVFGNFALSDLEALVGEVGFGRSGYGFLFSRDGHFIYHPRRDYLRKERVVAGRDTTLDTQTIFEVALARGDTALHTLGVTTINGVERIVDYRDPVTGQDAWIVYGPVAGPEWTIASVTLLDDLKPDTDLTRRALLRITTLAFLGTILLGGALRLGSTGQGPRSPPGGGGGVVEPARERSVWGSTAWLSMLSVAVIALVWFFTLRHPPSRFDDEIRVMDAAAVQQEMNREGGLLRGRTTIPTGVFLRSMDFESGVTIFLTGTVWQKYSLSEHEGIRRGVLFPEESELELVEVGRTVEGDTEIVEWSFRGRFRQEFDYEQYPIDRQEVWLRMTHADHRRDVVLTPDLDSYPITNPAALPGLADALVLPGWRMDGSYFSYREHEYSTNFGDAGFGFEGGRPELYFNVLVQREFLQPFISTIIPVLVAASMLFGMLLLSTKRADPSGLRGFSAMEVVLGSAALFFVVIFQHIAIRAEIPSQRIIYVEYFYFAMYVSLLLVSLNAIIFVCSSRGRWLHAGDNLAPKVLFWPVYLNALLLVTLWVFY